MKTAVGYNASLEAEARRIGEELDDLEREAGVRDAAENARRGRFFPDFNETFDEYAEAEHEHIRRAIRRVYFSIPDPAMRCRLIRADCRLTNVAEQVLNCDFTEAERQLARAKDEADRLPWGVAAAVAGGCVVLGYAVGGMPGAFGGAAIGFFVGQGTIHNARRDRRRAVAAAESEVASWRDTMAKEERRLPYFTAAEEATGEPDPDTSLKP